MLPAMRRLSATAMALFLSACLSNAHLISRGELNRLAHTPPEQRGEKVRVLQGFVGDEGPPPAPAVHSDTVIVVHGGGHVHGGGGGGGGGGPYKPPRPKNLAKSKSEDAKFWLVAAAVVAVTLAVSEGARWDGWVKLHPMYPVHLYGPYGEYTWVPLAQITPETAAWARKAYVREGEGPFTRLSRAPLNRRGWTYSLLLGSGEIPSSTGSTASGFLGHIQIGHFPLNGLGVQFDVAMGWRNDDNGAAVYDSRYGFELDVLPVRAGKLSAGGFAGVGLSKRFDDGPGTDNSGAYFGAGALLQIELTTRLAITGRAAYTQIYDTDVTDFTLGISVY